MNLLTEPVFRVQTPRGPQAWSLPALLAALGADTVESLPGLQRHQEDAFHIFLCYLAGAVLARADLQDPIQPEAFWRDGLRRLAGRSCRRRACRPIRQSHHRLARVVHGRWRRH